MAIARDWTRTLWPASYKGVPFFVDRDGEEGGRRIVTHEFPMRDIPYNEDLGEKKRTFAVAAYLASDRADADAAALTAICATRGAGVLVLPAHGQITARCTDFRRARDKDRSGYIAYTLDFVREGASSALATVLSLANLIFIQADALSAATATAFAAATAVQRVPDYVALAAIDGVQTAAAALDAIRVTAPVSTDASSAQRREIEAVFGAAPAMTADDDAPAALAARVMGIARALGDAMPAAAAVRTFSTLWSDLNQIAVSEAPAGATAGAQLMAGNQRASDMLLRKAALAAYGEAIARVPLADRPSAITLRADVAEYFEAEAGALSADQAQFYSALTAMRDAIVEYLSRAILDLAPVNTISANLSMPSLYWGWRLYGDPRRGDELVARNRVVHPAFMPLDFEALAD